METRIDTAVTEYLRRQERLAHPFGRFDRAGRFYLAEAEQRECCGSIRCPSRRWPYSQLTHARTAEHVARLYGVEPTELRRAARVARKNNEKEN